MSRVLFHLILFLLCNTLVGTELDKITIFSESYPPYSYINAEGKVVGSTAEKIAAIVQRAGIDYEIKLQPWKRSLAEQKRDPLALIYPLTRNRVREEHYQWLVPFRKLKLNLYGLSKKFDSDHDIKNTVATFVCYTESSYCSVLEEFGIPKSSIFIVSSTKVNKQFELLLRERVDFVIEADNVFNDFIQSKNEDSEKFVRLEKYQFSITDYLAANKNSDPSLNKRIRDAAKTLGFEF